MEPAPAPSELTDFDKNWNYANPKGTQDYFLSILPQARQSGDASRLGQLLTQIARAQGLQGNFEEAHKILDEAEPMADIPQVAVRLLLERGRALNSSNQADLARPLFQEAWDRALKAGLEFHAVDAAHMLGIVEKGEAAVAWNEQAMVHAEKAKNPEARLWLGSLYNNLGWTHLDQKKNPEKALELFRKALKWREAKGQERETRIARYCVARAARALGRLEEALAIQQDLHAQWLKAGERDGYVCEEIGECLLALGSPLEAKPFFRQAHEELSQDEWLVEHEKVRLERIKSLST
ncbi:MAG: tetratricopeptide repeat protein [Planctomycetota bacterium]